MSSVKLLLTALVLGALLVAAPAHAAPDPITLDGVKVKVRDRTRQVVTVNRTEGWHARVTFWAKDDGEWVERFQATDGAIGYNGLVRPRKRVQGSGKTPAGTFRLPWAFGMDAEKNGFDPSYRKVRRGDYWVLDNESKHYNRFRNKEQGGFRWWLDSSHADASERLKDYPHQYEWAVVTSFNRSPGQAPRRRDLPPRQRQRGDRGLRQRAALVHEEADVPPRPGPQAADRDRELRWPHPPVRRCGSTSRGARSR